VEYSVKIQFTGNNKKAFTDAISFQKKYIPLEFDSNTSEGTTIYKGTMITCSGKYLPFGPFKFYEEELCFVVFDVKNPRVGVKILDLSDLVPSRNKSLLYTALLTMLSSKNINVVEDISQRSPEKIELETILRIISRTGINPIVLEVLMSGKRPSGEQINPAEVVKDLVLNPRSILHEWTNKRFEISIYQDSSSISIPIELSSFVSGAKIADSLKSLSLTNKIPDNSSFISLSEVSAITSTITSNTGHEELKYGLNVSRVIVSDVINGNPQFGTHYDKESRPLSITSEKSENLMVAQTLHHISNGNMDTIQNLATSDLNSKTVSDLASTTKDLKSIPKQDMDIVKFVGVIFRLMTRKARMV
jgi:hypothetical protein